MQFSSIKIGYTKRQIIQYYLSEGIFCPDAFIRISNSEDYKLVYNASETELEKAMNTGQIKDYIVFTHILSAISCNDNFLSENQYLEIETQIGNNK